MTSVAHLLQRRVRFGHFGFKNQPQAIDAQNIRDIRAKLVQERFEVVLFENAQGRPVDDVHPREVFIGRRDHRAVRVLKAVEAAFQPFHRDPAQIDDIRAHGTFVRRDQGAHHVVIFEDDLWLGQKLLAHVFGNGSVARHSPVLTAVFRFLTVSSAGRESDFCNFYENGTMRPRFISFVTFDPVQRILMPAALMSARKASSPLSVSGWFAIALMTPGGAVITSAPINAASFTWLTVRIEAARICVS